MSDDPIDRSFRPVSYFWPIPNETRVNASDGVEIARIVLETALRDVTSVYVKAGEDRFHYRVSDGYDGDTLTAARAWTSVRPLKLGELARFLLAAWPLQEVLEAKGLDRAGAQAFIQASSGFYPEFGALVAEEIDLWYDGLEDEGDDDDDDDDDDDEYYPDDYPDPNQEAHDRWLLSLTREDMRRLAQGALVLMERKDREAATGSSDEPPV